MHNKKEMGRGTIYAMAGIYICITAYQMYGNLGTGTGSEQMLMIIFMILFAIFGAGLIALGGYMIYKGSKAQRDGTGSSGENSGKSEKNENSEMNKKDDKSM